MSTAHTTLKLLRKIHLYFGIFISPALLFFAFTGAMQTFSLHETTPGSSYKPPAWIATLAQLHKKQTTTVPPRRLHRDVPDQTATGAAKTGKYHVEESAPATQQQIVDSIATSPKALPAPAPTTKRHLPMKLFFLLVALGLFTSTLTGLYMAYKYSKRKVLLSALLLAGFLLPLLLLLF